LKQNRVNGNVIYTWQNIRIIEMMEIGVNAKRLVEEQIFSQMEISMLANIRTVNQAFKVGLHGILEANKNLKMELKW
jgi:hypothetical protein